MKKIQIKRNGSVIAEGMKLDSTQNKALLHALKNKNECSAFIWDASLDDNTIRICNLYIITDCVGIKKVEDIMLQKSIIEMNEFEDQEEAPLPKKPVMIDESEVEQQVIYQGLRTDFPECEEETTMEIQDVIPDLDIDTVLEIVAPPQLTDEEILNIFKREYCEEDSQCKHRHFFIAEGTIQTGKTQKIGIHIFPVDEVVPYEQLIPTFTSLFDKTKYRLEKERKY